jgi:Tfp pilus assembly protein PilF
MTFSLSQSRSTVLRICCLLLVLGTLAIYNPLTRAPYLNFDDGAYVVQNPHVHNGLSWETVKWAFTTRELANWHPLTWLSYALDAQLLGMKPAGFHYVNVLLHSLNVLLLFLLLERSTGKVWRSLMVAALFAVHPINVESVAWISERKNVLSMAFFLAGLLSYVWYARKPGVVRYLAVFSFFALGLMAKPQVITFPFVLLLMDYWPLERWVGAQNANKLESPGGGYPRRSVSSLLLEKIPLLALSAASAVITMKVQTEALHLDISFAVRLENALVSYGKYLRKAIWPLDLAPLYPHPMGSVSVSSAVIARLALVLITILALRAKRHRYIAFGWFWFLGTLVPMIGLVQVGVQAMADRYAYIPFIGLFIAACWGLADLLQLRPAPAGMTAGVSAVVLILLSAACYRQADLWTDNVRLWRHTLEVTRDNFTAEDCMATALIAAGKADESVPHLKNALRLNPSDPVANLNLAFYEQQQGDYAEAIPRYQTVLRFSTNPIVRATALTNIGYALYAQRQYALATQNFERAVNEFPQGSRALIGLGLLAQRSGSVTQAARYYDKAVEFQPNDESCLLLAQALEILGDKAGAQAARDRARRMSPDLEHATQAVNKLLSE